MTGAIFCERRPATIIKSACRGEGRNTSAPNRATSNRAAAMDIISIAQHARPNPSGQMELRRAQFTALSSVVKIIPSSSRSLPKSSGLLSVMCLPRVALMEPLHPHFYTAEPRKQSALKLSWFAAPFARISVRDRLAERPDVTGKILDVVLPFSVGMIRRLAYDSRSTLSCVFAMAMNILHSNHHVSAGFVPAARLHQHDGSISNVQLRAMTSQIGRASCRERV